MPPLIHAAKTVAATLLVGAEEQLLQKCSASWRDLHGVERAVLLVSYVVLCDNMLYYLILL